MAAGNKLFDEKRAGADSVMPVTQVAPFFHRFRIFDALPLHHSVQGFHDEFRIGCSPLKNDGIFIRGAHGDQLFKIDLSRVRTGIRIAVDS